jgi:hypothetical protein
MAKSELIWVVRRCLAESARRFLGRAGIVTSGRALLWKLGDAESSRRPDLALRRWPVRRSGPPDWVDAWRVWEIGSPELAVELETGAVEDGTRRLEACLGGYRHAGVREFVHFDPSDPLRRLRLWDAVDRGWVERDTGDSEFRRCDTLGLYWCVLEVPGVGATLRLARDRRGRDLVHTAAEDARQLPLSSSQRCFT